jgi:hypothetical protein
LSKPGIDRQEPHQAIRKLVYGIEDVLIALLIVHGDPLLNRANHRFIYPTGIHLSNQLPRLKRLTPSSSKVAVKINDHNWSSMW